MFSSATQFVISNALALIGAVLLIIQLLQEGRNDMFRVRCVSMGIMVVVFLVMACWSAVITTLFSFVMSIYEAFCKNPRNIVRIALSLASAAVAAAVQSWAAGLDYFTVLPVVSALLTGFGFCFSGNAGIMRIVQGCDSALWLVYDTCNLLFVNVFCDLIGVIMAGAYALLKRFDPEDGYWQEHRLSSRHD